MSYRTYKRNSYVGMNVKKRRERKRKRKSHAYLASWESLTMEFLPSIGML